MFQYNDGIYRSIYIYMRICITIEETCSVHSPSQFVITLISWLSLRFSKSYFFMHFTWTYHCLPLLGITGAIVINAATIPSKIIHPFKIMFRWQFSLTPSEEVALWWNNVFSTTDYIRWLKSGLRHPLVLIPRGHDIELLRYMTKDEAVAAVAMTKS